MDNWPIFIVGMPRSGTTLLRSLLNQHPLIAISPETHFLVMYAFSTKIPELCLNEYLLTDRFYYLGIEKDNLYTRLKEESNLSYRAIFDAIMREYAHFMKKPIYGEKTPGHYEHLDLLFEWYPKARVIWMVRDPRAVAASYQHVPWHNSRGGVIGPSIRWRSSMKKLESWMGDKRIIIIQYEKLILSTQETVNSIFDFLSLEPISKTDCETDRIEPSINYYKGWEYNHLRASSKKISLKSLDKWKMELDKNQIDIIECLTSKGMAMMNYNKTIDFKLGNLIKVYISTGRFVVRYPNIIINKISRNYIRR